MASAGEYGDTRLARGGSGCGGAGRRLPFCGNTGGTFPPFLGFAGCFPLMDMGALVVGTAGVAESDRLVYGGRGILSGFMRCIWNEIISNNCLSVRREPTHRGWFSHQSNVRKGRQEGWERTGFYCIVDEAAVLLPLYAHATGVLPVTGVGLVHFV